MYTDTIVYEEGDEFRIVMECSVRGSATFKAGVWIREMKPVGA